MKKGTLKNIYSYIKNYAFLIVISLLLSIAVVASTIAIPYLIGLAIDEIVGVSAVNFRQVLIYVNWIIGLVIATAILQYFLTLINNYVSFHVTKDIRNVAFDKIQYLPLSYLDQFPTGTIVSKITTDCEQFGEGLLMFLSQFFTSLLTILGILVLMFIINIWVALFVFVVTPVSLYVAKLIAKKSYNAFQQQSQQRAIQMSILDEYIGEQKVVQSYCYEEASFAKFQANNDTLAKTSLKAVFLSSLVNPSTRFINACIYATVALIGALIVVQSDANAITIGQLTCLLGYANQYMKPFNEISGVVTEMQNAFACVDRVFQLIAEPNETDGTMVMNDNLVKDIEIKHVDFSYQPERPLITNFNLNVKQGEKIAIVGPTGCGKTTFINLLMRFYPVEQGDICFDQTSVYELTKSSYRKKIGMVLQDTWLFEGTIRENLTMGVFKFTDEDLKDVCQKVKLYHFIEQLPAGFDTIIKDDSLLSVGQKQLLCIARVMLVEPEILILDEATSNIDTRTESIVQQAFDSLMQGKTSFIVAHRLSTIQEANRILVMEQGHIVEQGTHEELLKKDGLYSQIYNSQFITHH